MMILLSLVAVLMGLLYVAGCTSPRFYPERAVVPSSWALELSNELDTMARHEELIEAATLEDSVDAGWTQLHHMRVVIFDRAQEAGYKAWAASAHKNMPVTLRCPVLSVAIIKGRSVYVM